MLRIYAARPRPVAILLGADDQVRLWLNGEQVFENLSERAGVPDADGVPITLSAGWDTVLARVVNVTGHHVLYLRLSDAPTDLARK